MTYFRLFLSYSTQKEIKRVKMHIYFKLYWWIRWYFVKTSSSDLFRMINKIQFLKDIYEVYGSQHIDLEKSVY